MVALVRVCAVGLWIALSSILVPASPAHAQATAVRTITVTGEGQSDGAPDQAEITGGVVTEAATAADAVAANTAAMNQVFASLEGIGVPLARIQTNDFSVQPVFAQRQNTDVPRVTAYRISNQVRVRIEQLALVGTVLDALVRSGANQLHGISFSIRDARPLAERPAQRRARRGHQGQDRRRSRGRAPCDDPVDPGGKHGGTDSGHAHGASRTRRTGCAGRDDRARLGDRDVRHRVRETAAPLFRSRA